MAWGASYPLGSTMPQSLKLLVAEDSDADVFLLKRAFAKTGVKFSPRFVTDGQEAVDYLSGNGEFGNRDEYPMPALVILDLKMPRMNGFDVLKWLKSDHNLRATPVVILSSSDEADDVKHAYFLGASSYVVKPSDLRQLEELVRAIEWYWRGFCKLPGTLPFESN
jgi:CheY-like chemotaxis protein